MRMIRSGAVLVAAAGILWGTMGLWVRHLAGAGLLTTMEVVAVRAVGTCLMLWAAAALLKPSALRIRWKDLWCFAGSGLVSIVCFNYCYFTTIQRTSLGIAVILLYTSPIFVSILARIFFREPFTPLKCAALALMVVGCALVSGIGGAADALTPAGLLTGLGAGLCYALYSIFGCCAQERGYGSLTITAWTFLLAAAGIAPLVDWRHVGGVLSAEPARWGWCAGMVAVATILPYGAYTAGLARMEASRAAVLVAVEPVAATLLGVLLYHERLGWQACAGIALVLAAIFCLRR